MSQYHEPCSTDMALTSKDSFPALEAALGPSSSFLLTAAASSLLNPFLFMVGDTGISADAAIARQSQIAVTRVQPLSTKLAATSFPTLLSSSEKKEQKRKEPMDSLSIYSELTVYGYRANSSRAQGKPDSDVSLPKKHRLYVQVCKY